MRFKRLKVFIAFITVAALLFGASLNAAALDDKYYFEDIGISVKLSKNYDVITVNSERGDEVFGKLSMDYDVTMTAFSAAHIYLQAFDAEQILKLTLTVTSDDNSRGINNYSDLTSAQRQEILNNFLSSPMCTSCVEVKHGGNICYDLSLESESDSLPLYINQTNTVVNGMNINFTIQKSEEAITADETKILTNFVNSMKFDKINRTTGPAFDWWRVLLWIVILVAISFAISFIYRQYNKAKRKQLEERRHYRVPGTRVEPENEFSALVSAGEEPEITAEEHEEDLTDELTFAEALGYQSDSDYQRRAATDLESFDINVREKNLDSGMSYFEDSGKSINTESDYFDTYFKEPTEPRPVAARAAGMVGTYLKIALTHTGYFFKNLFLRIKRLLKRKT